MASEIAQTVDHALLTLAQTAGEGPRSIREVSEALGISTTAARRIVVTLHRTGMLRRREDGRYDIGPRLIRMTDHLLDRFAAMAHPAMTLLAHESARSVILTAFRADSAFVLHQVDATPHELHIEYKTGYSRDLVDGTDGMTILAHLDAARREAAVQAARTPGLTEQLERIRRDGHLSGRNAAWAGLPALSVPILDDNIGIIGALTVMGEHPEDRLIGHLDAARRAGAAVSEASSALTRGPGGEE